jgi:muramoyltetrapeptide carboxypeptidase
MVNTGYIQPAYIKEGDIAGIVAPAGIVHPEDIEPAIDILKAWGLQVAKGKYIYERYHFFAGTDEQRLEDLQAVLDDPSVKIIFFARGGYGSIRLIEKLNFEKFKKSPKWLVGYSDLTLFHIYIAQTLNCESIHGLMPKNFLKGQEDGRSLTTLKSVLFGLPNTFSCEYHPLNRSGEATGILTGGNLSLIYSLQGTRYEIDTRGKILFIEEVNEYYYHFERMMINLKMSGKLEEIAGLVVGGLTEMKNTSPEFGKDACEIIGDMIKDYSYPVMYGFPAGHMFPNLPLIMGRKTKMKVSSLRAEIDQKNKNS